MSFELAGFNANNYEEPTSFETLPAGTYKVVMKTSEVQKNSKGTGEQAVCQLEVVDGPHSGSSVSMRFNLWHMSDAAKNIAWREFAAVCRAVGVPHPNGSHEIHDKPFAVVLKVRPYEHRKDDGTTETRQSNEVTKVMSLQELAQHDSTSRQAAAAAPPQSAAPVPPPGPAPLASPAPGPAPAAPTGPPWAPPQSAAPAPPPGPAPLASPGPAAAPQQAPANQPWSQPQPAIPAPGQPGNPAPHPLAPQNIEQTTWGK